MSVALVTALLLQVAYPTSGTTVMASQRVETYDVAGTTAEELLAQIGQYGPTDPNTGLHYTGDLKWDLHWTWVFRTDAHGCRVDHADVRIDTVMTLPRWTNARQGPNALQTDWDVFLSRLTEHERGHRSNAVKAAQAVREAIEGVGSAADCRELDPRANQAARAAFEHWKEVDIDYDTATRHGQTQGAVLR